MANNWNYNDFQNWFCKKFKKPNPLPWQDAMGALIDYITNEIPDNIQVVLNKLTSGTSSATLTGNGTPDNPFVLTINLSMVDFKGEKGDTGATGPQGPQGTPGAGINTLDQIELTAVSSMTYDTTNGWQVVYTAVLDYNNGDTHTTTANARLPIKPGDNVTIDVAADGKSLIIKAAGGGGHMYALTDGSQGAFSFVALVPVAEEVTTPTELITKWKAEAGGVDYLPCAGDGSSGWLVGLNFSSLSAPAYTYVNRSAAGTGTDSFNLSKCKIKKIY